MVKEIAIDTNIAIALLNNQSSVFSLLDKYKTIFLPVTVCGELLFGAKNSGLSERNTKKYIDFIESCELLDVNLAVADNYSSVRLQLKQKGKPIPENDIWIAATCLTYKVPLCTFDKHFKQIEKLKLVVQNS